MEEKTYKHKSYGMIQINKFQTSRGQFFGSDLVHNNAISISIHRGSKQRHLSGEWYHSGEELIRVEMTANQFVDAITSGMNTEGIPCTILRFGGNRVEQIEHVEDKKEMFRMEMQETHEAYKKRIDDITAMLDGNIGKKTAERIKFELGILKSHISDNADFVMKSFNESMEKTVTEAKHTISNYIDSKVHAFGIEGLRSHLQVAIESNEAKKEIKENNGQ